MSSALTVIVLGHAFFNTVPNTLPAQHNCTEVASSTQAPFTTEIPNITTTEPTTSIPESTTSIREDRRPDYIYIPGVGSHKVHRYAKSWDDARQICQWEGGDLAVINSKVEAMIIGHLIKMSQPHIDSEYSDLAHIGFTDHEEEGRYVTVDGQSFSDAGYEEWRNGEPNDGGNQWSTDDCGAINIDGLLVDANCVRHYAFVCELSGLVGGSSLSGITELPPHNWTLN